MLAFLLHVIFVLLLTTQRTCARTNTVDPNSQLLIDDDTNDEPKKNDDDIGGCSINVDHDNFFGTLKKLEDDNKDKIAAFEKAVGPKRLDDALMQSILSKRGLSNQAVQQNLGRIDLIPAGLDLGGYCIVRMLESFLLFDRMKVRNSTKFKIQLVENDLNSLVVRTRLTLNDLHLQGTYERLMQDGKSSNLFYSPTQGVADIMLKDVEYKMEGRYRMMNDRIMIDIVVSHIRLAEAVLVTESMSGQNKSPPFRLRFDQIEDLLQRLKGDLDIWMKDCFNDRLMSYNLGSKTINDNYLKYNLLKTAIDNNYFYYLIGVLHDKIRQHNMEALSLPDFTVFSADGTIFRIRNGALRGLDSIYKKSVASSYLDGTLRHVCAEIGFSHLQVSYTYEAFPATPNDDNYPALTGTLILSAKDLTAILIVGVMIDPNSVELSFQGIKQLGTESLTIEGAVNKELGKFRHIIQKHVMALMSYSINFHVRNLKTLTDCKPNMIPYYEPRAIQNPIKKRNLKNKKKGGPLSNVKWWMNNYGDSDSSSSESSYEHKGSSSNDESKGDTSIGYKSKGHKHKEHKHKGHKHKEHKHKGHKHRGAKQKVSKNKENKHKVHNSQEYKSKEDKSNDTSKENNSKEHKHKEHKHEESKHKVHNSQEYKSKDDKSKENNSKELKHKDEESKHKVHNSQEYKSKDDKNKENENKGDKSKQDKPTSEKDTTTTVTVSVTDSYEIISQGLFLRNSRRYSNKSNYNKDGKNRILVRQLRRRFRPLRDSV